MTTYEISKQARLKVLELICKAQTSHIGSNLSVIDILTVLYEKAYITKEDWENRDRIILSKGWAAASLYFFLARKGLISEEELASYCQPGSKYIGLAEPVADGIEFAGGSMGHGLPAGVGMALAAKKLKKNYKVYVVMSDGELACGTTWESLLLAAKHELDNLYVLVDSNKWQAMGRVKDIVPINFNVFDEIGLIVDVLNGHSHLDIEMVLNLSEADRQEAHRGKMKKRPRMLVCNTTKGKGVSFMEDRLEWHYRNIDDESYRKAKDELSQNLY